MKAKSSGQLVKQLFEMVQNIKLNDAAAIFGTTSKESLVQELRMRIAVLGAALNDHLPYEDIMAAYERAVSTIDTAGITGLISEAELPEYYKLIDDIWATIEHEKAPPDSK